MKMTTNRATLARSAVLAAALIVGCGPRDESAKRETAVTPGKYADVNGLRMYYEIHGTGRPLVLLHGGLAHIESSFGKMLPSLAKTRRVIGIEQQGHGHTADIDRPLTYEQMADDTAELLRRLGITGADFFGWSDGGSSPPESPSGIRSWCADSRYSGLTTTMAEYRPSFGRR